MNVRRVLLVALIMSLASACHRDNEPCMTCPPPYVPRVSITVDDVAVTDAWIELMVPPLAGSPEPRITTVQLRRNGETIFDMPLSLKPNYGRHNLSLDSVVLDEKLLPQQTYTYKAYLLIYGIAVDSSAPLRLTTMKPSSQNWSWQIYTLGSLGSTISDVAILNDTCAWAVGRIFQFDSAGQAYPTLYNAAQWNGAYWTLQRIPYYYQGQPLFSPIRTVFVVADNDMWFGIGNLIRWNGQHYEAVEFPSGVWGPYYVNKIWGSSSNNIYVVGENGSIAHYDGRTWQKLETGTTLDIQDIWGSTNKNTGELEVMAVASLPYTSYERKILKISGTTVTTLSDSAIQTPLTGVWFVAGRKYYVVGDSIYTKRNSDESSLWLKDIASYYSNSYNWAVSGTGLSDVVVVGDNGGILHFNGFIWKWWLQTTSGTYYRVAMRGDMIVAVGDNYGAAGVIAIGRR